VIALRRAESLQIVIRRVDARYGSAVLAKIDVGENRCNPVSHEKQAFTGEGNWFERQLATNRKAEAALSYIGFPGCASRASGANWRGR
jgi:hypothetical protein